ncbi:MAG: TlyA family RNA methyltransferase [Chloroflexi bacterium]|nr:TlyA family RNA methyltransferase [Chloroflexota bacterium]
MTAKEAKPRVIKTPRQRLDVLMVDRGLAGSRARAQALIMAGEVSVDGEVVTRAGTLVATDSAVNVLEPPRYVSRGGLKLEHALDQFQIDVSAMVAADIGASTGGFTDCLLQRGASRVYAIDVGYGQLDYRLRQDPRVVVMEKVNARYPIPLPGKVDLATIDVSFISLEKVIPSVAGVVKDDGRLLALVKPQFEARRNEVGKGGVIRDPLVQARVLGRFIGWAVNSFRLEGLTASPVPGGSGNREFFVLLVKK